MKYGSNRLRVLRAEKRITQLDLGMASSISQNRIWKLENGYVEATDREKVALARVLKVEPHDIFPVPDEQARTA